jgi:tetratricopeptide (TPR) repeat protein
MAMAAAARLKADSATIATITEQLASKDPAVYKQALAAVRTRMRAPRGLMEFRTYYLRALTLNKMHEDVISLTREAILIAPAETRSVELALQARIHALLALDKTQEALSDAKSLFNVASMAGTSEAILTLAECLNAAHPDDPGIFNQFRAEQVAGAATQPVTAATTQQSGPHCAALEQIKVDGQAYVEAVKRFPGEDVMGLLARGNLLLMADRIKEARAIFQRLYSLSGADINEASEALARVMKAEDGTIGRANSWVLSIRPKK